MTYEHDAVRANYVLPFEHEATRAKKILARSVIHTDIDGKASYLLDDEGRLELDEMMHALARSPDMLRGSSYSYDTREFVQDFSQGEFASIHFVYDVREQEARVRIYLHGDPHGMSNPHHGDANQAWNLFQKTTDDFREDIARTLAIHGKEYAPAYQALLASEAPPMDPTSPQGGARGPEVVSSPKR